MKNPFPYNLPKALQRRRKLERDLAIARHYDNGVPTATLAKDYKMTRSQVCKIIREIKTAKND